MKKPITSFRYGYSYDLCLMLVLTVYILLLNK